jgi:hypothetical protein
MVLAMAQRRHASYRKPHRSAWSGGRVEGGDEQRGWTVERATGATLRRQPPV